jgi:hypothetical protein
MRSFGWGTSKDHDLCLGILGHLTDCVVEGSDQVPVQSVTPRWPIEGYDPDPTVYLGKDHRHGIVC